MRFRSRKREAVYRERRKLVADLLTQYPICQRCGTNPSVDVHELIRRSQWRDGILNPANCRAVCRSCHIWIGMHPRQATEEGWSVPSWQRDRFTQEWEGQPE